MLKFAIPGLLLAGLLCNSSCQTTTDVKGGIKDELSAVQPKNTPATEKPAIAATDKIATATTILARPQVPVLCYHQIRNWNSKDGKVGKDYIVPIAEFKAQMKMLADSGYNTILPDELYNYLNTGAKLPAKPIMLTFDDNDLDHFTEAAPEMKKYGFKGVFFIMTVTLGRPGYMTKAQVKSLSDEGHLIGSHTWDHQNVKKYQGDDWVKQIEKPNKTLMEITGKEVKYFAYPFGLWNPEAFPQLKKRGIIAAFVLAEKRDENDPLFSIRRIIASGYWSPKTLSNNIRRSF